MSNIEDEIVSMQFDNKQFESGVATSLGTIDKLKGSLAFPDAGKGLSDVNTAVGRFNMTPMSSAIQGVSKLWLGLTTVALTAISNITNKVVDAGLTLAKSFTLDPITQGFSEYEKNLNSIQTIMANTGKSVGVVNGYLNQLNHYSDQTIYSFGTMADSIGKFTAAGVNISDATSAIKGMANSAALGGSSVEQLNTAMYQVSQALATGTIRLMDWNSISTAGLGGTNMQKAFEATARTAADGGAAMDAAVSSAGNFRDSLQAGWFSADIFNKTMKVFAGNTLKSGKTVAFTVKQLQGMGYSVQAAQDLNKLSQAAIDSATKVKTFTQLIDVVKESIGSGWAKIFQDLFGNFEQASKLWTSVSNTITGQVSKIFGAIDKALVGWRKLGGFEDLWATIGNIFKVIGNLIHPVIALFTALLPSTGKAGSGLAKFTGFLADFTGFLVKLTDPIGNFTINLSFMGKLFKIVGGTVGAFLGALQPLLPILSQLGNYVGDLFNEGMGIAGNLIAGWTAGLDPAALQQAAVDLANSWITWIKDALGIHSPASTMIPIGLNIMQGIVQGLQNGASFVIGALQKIFLGLGAAVKYMAENISWGDVLDTINTGLFLGLVLTFRQFVKAFTGTLGQFQAILGKAGGVLDQVTSNLKTMQSKVKSEIIRNIAISVALLAASALLLSTIDAKKLGIALGAIGGLMAGLILAMRTLTGGSAKDLNGKQIAKTSAQLLAIGTAMIAFSTAILILTGAVAIMGQLDPKTIEKGLAGIAGVVAIITTATAILSKTGGGATILATATALLIMSAALTAFVGVMKLYEKLDWKTLVRGGGSAAAVILAVGLAMRGFGKGAIGGSVGLVVASAALIILAKAMQMFASIGLADMIKSVVALDFILASIAGAALIMSGAEGGASSLLVMSFAIIVLAKALQILAAIPMLDLLKAIGALVLSLAIIAGAAILLAPAVPLIAALGSAVLLLGLAVLAAGVGVLAFATGMGILAVVGPAAFAALADGIDILLEKLPQIGEAIGGFLVSILTGIVKAAGPLAKALGALIGILLDEVVKLIPKLQNVVQKLINAIFEIIIHSYGHAARVMLNFVLNMLQALSDGVPKMIKKGTELIIGVITGLGQAATKIANATGRAILDFLKGLDAAIVKYEDRIVGEGVIIAGHLVTGLVNGLTSQLSWDKIRGAVESMANAIPGWAKKVLGILSPSKVMRDEVGKWIPHGLAEGIAEHSKVSDAAAKKMGESAFNALRDTFSKSKAVADGLGDLKPKITPVLDLSQVERDARGISAKMGSQTISADVSRRQARDIASDHAARHGSGGQAEQGNKYEFNQYNSSPEPINHVKAYRGTKSQIALFKEVTGK